MEFYDGPRPDLDQIRQRILQKKVDYARYNFARVQNDLLRTFFDLAQEFDALHDFFRICVTVPLEFLDVETNLYIVDEENGTLELICSSLHGIDIGQPDPPAHIHLSDEPYESKDSYVVPIKRKMVSSPLSNGPEQNVIMGMFEIQPVARLSPEDRFFFTKYSNRIGYNLHNRMIGRQNVLHLKFINNLVHDIEHNVLAPNIYFKHLFNRLKKKIAGLDRLEQSINKVEKTGDTHCEDMESMVSSVQELHQDLFDIHHDLQSHHANYSLSLESLLRRDHFRMGHFVLRPTSCHIEKDIIVPQLEYYQSRFKSRGVTIDQPKDMQGEEFPIMVDVGLLSQVYDNLFSNAVKYAEEITFHGNPKKTMAYGREVLKGYFDTGKDGVKFNVFTTGPQLDELERKKIFSDGYRGVNVHLQPGTGHGLAFVKQVIEIHGGRVGCEVTDQGNNLYFILPLPATEDV